MKYVVWLAAKSAAFQLEIYSLQEHKLQSGKIVIWLESTPDWIYNRPKWKHCLNLDIESPEKYFFDQRYISGKVEIQNTTEQKSPVKDGFSAVGKKAIFPFPYLPGFL